MTSPSINYRLAQFLGSILPFSMMEESTLLELASKVEIRFLEKDEPVFAGMQHEVAVVREGAIQVRSKSSGRVVDVCAEGDLVGNWKINSNFSADLIAYTLESSLLYYIPLMEVDQEVSNNSKLSNYFSSFDQAQSEEQAPSHAIAPNVFHQFKLTDIIYPSADEVMTCSPEESIQQAAERMTEEGISSLLVLDAQGFPVGILTDRDLRSKVATGKESIHATVGKIMSAPVLTIRPNSTLAEVKLMMIKFSIHHLCVTEDGSDKSKVLGIVTDTNILFQQGDDPVALVGVITKSRDIGNLKDARDKADDLAQKYIENDVSIGFVTQVLTEINDSITRRCITMAMELYGIKTRADFSWIALGSAGRREQILRTDQDNAIIYKTGIQKDRFLDLGKQVCEWLTEIGFKNCPAGMMASNPQWNLSLEEWQEVFSDWIHASGPEELMHATIFFDMRRVSGSRELLKQLFSHTHEEIKNNPLFIHLLASNATQNPPPLGLFRNVIVEKTGEHKDNFDLKARVMMPLVDAARTLVFAIGEGTREGTIDRYEFLASHDKNNRSLFLSARDAFVWLLKLRAGAGFKHQDSGRYIRLTEYNQWEQKNLKQAFSIVDDLHLLLNTRFQLDYIRK